MIFHSYGTVYQRVLNKSKKKRFGSNVPDHIQPSSRVTFADFQYGFFKDFWGPLKGTLPMPSQSSGSFGKVKLARCHCWFQFGQANHQIIKPDQPSPTNQFGVIYQPSSWNNPQEKATTHNHMWQWEIAIEHRSYVHRWFSQTFSLRKFQLATRLYPMIMNYAIDSPISFEMLIPAILYNPINIHTLVIPISWSQVALISGFGLDVRSLYIQILWLKPLAWYT